MAPLNVVIAYNGKTLYTLAYENKRERATVWVSNISTDVHQQSMLERTYTPGDGYQDGRR